MSSHRVRIREPRGELRAPTVLVGDETAAYLQDAARTPAGHAPAVYLPSCEAEVAWVLRESEAVLPVGAQSSLTGGATPFGQTVLSLSRLAAIGLVRGDRVRVEAGVPLLTLEAALREHGLFFPPVPTFRSAFAGGVVSTNAAGAATFKYGTTRAWVQGLTVILASGDVLDLERGQCRADADDCFEIEGTRAGVRRVRLPRYRPPSVPKRSAGYEAAPGLDLVDLFVGSEGTLGVVSAVELRVIPEPPRAFGWVALESEGAALALVARLRDAARATWAAKDPRGIDIAAIESLDRRCLELLREDGKDREQGVRVPAGADTALLFQAELPQGADAALALDELGRLDDATRPDTPLVRLALLLRAAGVLEDVELALPGETRHAQRLLALREAAPLCVNHRIAAAQRQHPDVHKTAADMIVPFKHLPGMLMRYREGFARRGLDHAIWGHVSDGNLHANAIPRDAADVRLGEEAILEFGDEVLRLGGCPMSEHGVGRNPVKQELLRRLYGDAGIEQMRAVKQALDPGWKLAPGVLFPPAPVP
jgi:D-lactate dehydrogenase (cytochrome)